MCTSRLTSQHREFRPAIAGNGDVRANLVGDPHLSSPSTKEWFNTAAFAPPAPFTFGNSGRNSLRADWFKNLDVSLFRDFPLAKGEVFSSEPRRSTLQILQHGEFRSTI